MEQQSPVKDWLRKHSPIKLRQKPLPPSPSRNRGRTDSHPLTTVSGNTSPTKTQETRSKFRSFLRSKASKSEQSTPSPPHKSRRSRFSLSQASNTVTSRSPIHKSYRRTSAGDLRHLSRKISSLETQLLEAKQQLDTVSRHASRDNSVERERRADEERQQRQRRSYSGEQHHGLVEGLLMRSQRARYAPGNGVSCKSTNDLGHMIREHQAVEDHFDKGNHGDMQQDSPKTQKRKRSELRQRGWEQIQAGLQEERIRRQQQQEEQQPDRQTKRARRASSMDSLAYSRNKCLPLSPIEDLPYADAALEQETETLVKPGDQKPRAKKFRRSSVDKSLPNPPLAIPDISPIPPPITSTDAVFPANLQPRKHKRRQSSTLETAPVLPEASDPAEALTHTEESDSASTSPSKRSRHRRGRSQIIVKEDLDEALGIERTKDPSSDGEHDQQRGTERERKRHLPSPEKWQCPSPARLERVEEEYEWDEDIF